MLVKFKQLGNITEFSKKYALPPHSPRTTQESKIANFVKLQPVFKNLKIKFDSNLVDKIMKQEKGAALRVLYQLRMALEKVYPPTDITVLRKSDMQPAKKIVPAREAYDNQTSGHFKVRLQEKNRAQKNINLDLHQKRFEDTRARQEAEARFLDKQEEEMKIRHKVIHKQLVWRANVVYDFSI